MCVCVLPCLIISSYSVCLCCYHFIPLFLSTSPFFSFSLLSISLSFSSLSLFLFLLFLIFLLLFLFFHLSFQFFSNFHLSFSVSPSLCLSLLHYLCKSLLHYSFHLSLSVCLFSRKKNLQAAIRPQIASKESTRKTVWRLWPGQLSGHALFARPELIGPAPQRRPTRRDGVARTDVAVGLSSRSTVLWRPGYQGRFGTTHWPI